MNYPYQYASLFLDSKETALVDSDIGVEFDGTKSFTIDAWVKTEESVYFKSIISKEGMFDFGIDGGIPFFSLTGYPTVIGDKNNLTVIQNEWVHVCVVYNTSYIWLYVNGIVSIFSAVRGNGTKNQNQFVFGKKMLGLLREVRIFNTALSVDQVNEYMMKTDISDSSFHQLLAAYYNFSEAPPKELIKNKQIILENDSMQVLFSNGALFNGNSFLNIDRDPFINPAGKGNDSYTVQSWVFFDINEYEERQTIFANGDINDFAGMSLYIEKVNNKYYVKALRGVGDGNNSILCSSSTVMPRQWINITTTYSVDTMKIYINGKLDSSLGNLFPIPMQLSAPRLRIGAEVVENNVNGQYWFTGSISRLDLWNKELGETDIVKYANETPEFNTADLQASFAFHQDSNINSCTGSILGERNHLEFGEVMYSLPKGTVFNESFFEKEIEKEPLSDEHLASFRKLALNDKRAKIMSSHIKEVGSTLKESNLPNGPFFFNVTSHIIGDKIYFVAHDNKCSYTMCSSDSLEFNDSEIAWWIELLLILIGGVISIIFQVKIANSTKLVNVLVKSISNPSIQTLFSHNISATVIIEFFKLLFTTGAIRDILKAAFSGFSCWKALWMLTKIVILAALSVVGGWGYYIAALGILAGEVIYHLTKKPREISSISLVSVMFHDSRLDYTIGLRTNNTTPVPVPEWTSNSMENSHTAYRFDTVQCSITVKASFQSSGAGDPVSVRCRNTSLDNLFGDSNQVLVNMSGGISSVDFSFSSHSLKTTGVKHVITEFTWEYYNNETNTWVPMRKSKHNIYIILTLPSLPWSSGDGPWVELLKYACEWASGSKSVDEALKKMTETVNANLNLKYDIVVGTSSYINRVNFKFKLSDFLSHLHEVKYSNVVNCTDCATILATFANGIGCRLSEKRMGGSWFECNPILAIGYTDWTPPTNGGFGYHEVCMKEPLQKSPRISSVAENSYYVYDACLKVNGSATPDSPTNRHALLPVGMHFSEFDNDIDYVPSIEKDKSYREHLATNSADGIMQCDYDYGFNGEIQYIYKDVE